MWCGVCVVWIGIAVLDCFRVGKRHGVRFTSGLLRLYCYVTRARELACSLRQEWQLQQQQAGSSAEEVKMRGRGGVNI
jgi:hypothetical protein